MKATVTCVLAMVLSHLCIVAFATEAASTDSAACAGPSAGNDESVLLRVYEVNRKISDFPDTEDLSTPQAAYATFNRILASGEREPWRRLGVPRNAKRGPADVKKTVVSAETARQLLETEVLEVRVFRGTFAQVFARELRPDKSKIDIRSLELDDGRWLNVGNDGANSLAEARNHFARMCGHYAKDLVPLRIPVEDPDAYLEPFVEFLDLLSIHVLPKQFPALLQLAPVALSYLIDLLFPDAVADFVAEIFDFSDEAMEFLEIGLAAAKRFHLLLPPI